MRTITKINAIVFFVCCYAKKICNCYIIGTAVTASVSIAANELRNCSYFLFNQKSRNHRVSAWKKKSFGVKTNAFVKVENVHSYLVYKLVIRRTNGKFSKFSNVLKCDVFFLILRLLVVVYFCFLAACTFQTVWQVLLSLSWCINLTNLFC